MISGRAQVFNINRGMSTRPDTAYHNNTLNSINLYTIHQPNNVTLTSIDYACNLGVIFDNNLSFAQNIHVVSKTDFHNIRTYSIRNTID